MKNVWLVRSATASVAVLAGAVFGIDQPPRLTAAQGVSSPAAGIPGCGSAAFLTFEQGRLAAVDWVDRTANRMHTRVVLSLIHISNSGQPVASAGRKIVAEIDAIICLKNVFHLLPPIRRRFDSLWETNSKL